MWDKLKVKDFITLYDIDVNQNLTLPEKQQKMLAYIEGVDEEVYDYIKYRELIRLFNEKLSFWNNIPETKPVDYLQVGDNRYKFCFEVSEITSGQYIDISSFGQEVVAINKIAACFFLPMQGDKYIEYGVIPHDKVADDLLEANFLEVYSCMVFFYQLFKELISDTIIYSSLSLEMKRTLLRLWQDGVGLFLPKK
jgi:hypothetical protein